MSNKSRTAALIIHKSWQIKSIYRDPTGSLIGVVASNTDVDILFVSAYLPATLDRVGLPEVWNVETRDATQEEAHAIYASLREWTHKHPFWIVGGDLNETRSLMDRKRIEIHGEEKELKRKIKEKERKQLRKRKGTFVDDFLEITNGVDIWRHLYPDSGGFT